MQTFFIFLMSVCHMYGIDNDAGITPFSQPLAIQYTRIRSFSTVQYSTVQFSFVQFNSFILGFFVRSWFIRLYSSKLMLLLLLLPLLFDFPVVCSAICSNTTNVESINENQPHKIYVRSFVISHSCFVLLKQHWSTQPGCFSFAFSHTEYIYMRMYV